jgi:hypothetical protein
MNESPEIGILNAIGKLVLLVNGRMKTCKKAKEMKGYLEIMNQLLDIQQKVVALIPKITITTSVDKEPHTYTAPPLPSDTVVALYAVIVEPPTTPWRLEGTYLYAGPFGIEGTYAYAAPFGKK